jgi:hypothetical protein
MAIGNNTDALRLLSGAYTSWLLRTWVLTYLLTPLLYEWFWPHTDDYENAYGFWGVGYPVLLFLVNASIGLPMLLGGIISQDYVIRKTQFGMNIKVLLVIVVFLLMLVGQMALKAMVFSAPLLTVFKDGAGPTFVAAAISLVLQSRLLFRK